MTDTDDDQILRRLFAEKRVDIEGADFVSQTLADVRSLKIKIAAFAICIALTIVIVAWMFGFSLALAQFFSELITTALFDFGDNWLGFILSPLNSIAGLIFLVWRIYLLGRRRAFGDLRFY